ncbi:hypothetical protein PCE1_000888 [Barthelona sp. PCE]
MPFWYLFVITALFLCVSRAEDLVTCASAIKMRHETTKHFLHSHQVTYGSGSGQQSVTCFPEPNDHNSYWIVMAPHGKPQCERGEPIMCGSVIRLMHLQTKKMLHSHEYRSPLSQQQEVSCFGDNGEGDSGDNWQLICKKGTEWSQNKRFRLRHVNTKNYLHSHQHTYSHPISGQLEVTAFKLVDKNDRNNDWTVSHGSFFTLASDWDEDYDDEDYDDETNDL